MTRSNYMNTWRPITEVEFNELFTAQYAELCESQKITFDQFRIPLWKAAIRRSDQFGDERVFVVAQIDDGILYFDDVEYGFNISTVDESGRILHPGGSQNTLKEAIDQWFPKIR